MLLHKDMEIDESIIMQAVEDAARSVATRLQKDHSWENDSGQMAQSIKVTTESDQVVFLIDVPYASYVEASKPYVSDLTDELETVCTDAIENILGNIL